MRKRPQDAKAIHVMSSGLKAGATWSRVEILQARASALGHGGLCGDGRLVNVALGFWVMKSSARCARIACV